MKKLIGLSVIVVVIIGTPGALAAEPDVNLVPQLASDVQFIPADATAPTACPLTGPCCEIDGPAAICGCETGGVPRICDGHEVPRATFNVDARFMNRRNPGESVPFADGDTGANLPDASQFSFGNHSGIASGVTRDPTENHGPELRYRWMGEATASTSNTVPPAPGPAEQWSRQSRSQTVELSIRQHFDWFGDVIGFRDANPKEQSSGVPSRPGEPSITVWDTQNNLFGAQIEGYGKAGANGNSAATGFAMSGNLVPINLLNFANASLQLTPHIALRGGYQVLWFDGVAVASRQVPTTGNFNFMGQATSHVDSAGTLLNQCAKPSLEVTW